MVGKEIITLAEHMFWGAFWLEISKTLLLCCKWPLLVLKWWNGFTSLFSTQMISISGKQSLIVFYFFDFFHWRNILQITSVCQLSEGKTHCQAKLHIPVLKSKKNRTRATIFTQVYMTYLLLVKFYGHMYENFLGNNVAWSGPFLAAYCAW